MNLHYTHTRLLVRDFAACYRFYRDVLCCEPGWGDENGPYADFRTGNVSLALFDQQEMANAISEGAKPIKAEAQDCVALVFTVDNVDHYCTELAAKGVTFLREAHDRRDWGGRVAHFRDPAGNLIELFQPIQTEE